ncbi:hypothetical protein [Bosea sp. 117]|uniref:hypothetical protein n=1 Tax=Bosea sp. 117 TaxID=1125973 RepID=UPI0004940D00|nr:hypothetical protein [Bosea sp. 117]
MNTYEIVRIRLVRAEQGWREAPANLPTSTPVWSSFGFFVDGETATRRPAVMDVATSLGADVIPAPGGAWVHGEYNDLERVIRAIA